MSSLGFERTDKYHRVTFTVPTGLDATKLPVYSGKVLISGSNGEELGIPYFGEFVLNQFVTETIRTDDTSRCGGRLEEDCDSHV